LFHKVIVDQTISSHREILPLLEGLAEQMSKCCSEISENVGSGDPILTRLSNAQAVIDELIRDIEY